MASSTASLTKFSEAISSRPSCWRRTSLSMATAISGSLSARERDIQEFFIGLSAHFLRGTINIGTMDFHPHFGTRNPPESELRVEPVSVSCSQRPAPQPLQLRMLHDAPHQQL